MPPVVTTKSGNRPVFKPTVRTLLPNPLPVFTVRCASFQFKDVLKGKADICTMSVTPSDETLIVTLEFEGQFDPSRPPLVLYGIQMPTTKKNLIRSPI